MRFERVLPAPIETVWQYLVDPALRARWFMGGAIEPHAGGRIEIVMDHRNLSDIDVPTPERYVPFLGTSWKERIVRISPPRELAFTWEQGEAGEVAITLTSEADATRLVLHHTSLRGRDDAANFGGGWHSHLAVLEARLAGRGVADFWTIHRQSEATIGQALGDAGG